MTVTRARKIQRFLSQPFNVGEVFTGLKGVTVPVEETVESFEALVNGDLDEVPEQAFFNVGGAESVLAKAHDLGQRLIGARTDGRRRALPDQPGHPGAHPGHRAGLRGDPAHRRG